MDLTSETKLKLLDELLRKQGAGQAPQAARAVAARHALLDCASSSSTRMAKVAAAYLKALSDISTAQKVRQARTWAAIRMTAPYCCAHWSWPSFLDFQEGDSTLTSPFNNQEYLPCPLSPDSLPLSSRTLPAGGGEDCDHLRHCPGRHGMQQPDDSADLPAMDHRHSGNTTRTGKGHQRRAGCILLAGARLGLQQANFTLPSAFWLCHCIWWVGCCLHALLNVINMQNWGACRPTRGTERRFTAFQGNRAAADTPIARYHCPPKYPLFLPLKNKIFPSISSLQTVFPSKSNNAYLQDEYFPLQEHFPLQDRSILLRIMATCLRRH